MKVSRQFKIIFMTVEELVCDKLISFPRVLDQLIVLLVLRDEVGLQASAEGLILLMLPAEAFQSRQPQCSHLC